MALSERELRILHELEQSLQADRRRRRRLPRPAHPLRRVTAGGVLTTVLCLTLLAGGTLVSLGALLAGTLGLTLSTAGALTLAAGCLRLGWVWHRRAGPRR